MDKSKKSADAFRTISEVSDILDVPQHVLRFWEGKFSQIKPMKRGGNRRYYRPEDLELLRAITHLLYTDGYTIKGVQKLLRENGVRATVNTHIAEHGAFQHDGNGGVVGLDEIGDATDFDDNVENTEDGASEIVSSGVMDLAQDDAAASSVDAATQDAAADLIDEPAMALVMPDAAVLQNAAQVIEELKSIQAILKP